MICTLFIFFNLVACTSNFNLQSSYFSSIENYDISSTVAQNKASICSQLNNSSSNKVNSRFESIPEIIEETQYYKITYSNFKFTYYLYNDKHKIIDKKTLDNCKPQTSILGNKIIKVRIQAGTGVESVWTYYYDINKNLFSKTFDGTFDEYNDLVIYMKNLNVLVVENMFDQKKFYKEINKFKYKLSSIPSTPFSKVKFIDNGQMIKVTYFTENGSKEETETFALK